MKNPLYVILLAVICISNVPQENKADTTKDRNSAQKHELQDIIGITHVSGKYYLTDKDYLNEGADQILALGSRVIKVWFDNPPRSYPFNSEWPKMNSFVEMAQSPHFQKLFNKPFTTYIMMCFSVGHGGGYWINGITEQQKQDEQRQFYELAKYLLTKYKNTGKTFVLQHWEGDWLIRGNFDAKKDPTPTAIKSMIEWLNARQAGVNQARREVGQHGVHVYHAAEVNRVVDSMKHGKPNMVISVLPHTNMDLVSYSAWDAATAHFNDPNVLRDALDLIAKNTPDSPDFGDKNVYMGEFGMPENEYSAEQIQEAIPNAVQTALDWGCPYIVYWQLYCNELKKGTPPVKNNDDVRGFWLIRPDGSKAWTWEFFYQLLNNKSLSQPRGYSIPLIDLAGEKHRQVFVDKEPGQYLGHPTTVLLEDNKTIITVYPKGHGRGAIVMKKSTDCGLTWSERLPVPDNWATSKEVPTIHRVIDPKGTKRLIMFSGLYPIRMAVSEDDGSTWTPLKPIGDFGGVVVMASVVRLKNGDYMALFHDDGRFLKGAGKRTKFQVFKIISKDGGLTWSQPKVIVEHPTAHLCEPGAVRSPDGKQLAILLRENSRKLNSFVSFSNDEGKTWSKPKELPGALTGDRHVARYGPDGRLVIVFRDMTHESPTKGDFVAWVGTYDDIVNGREGRYRVRLLDNKSSPGDTGYAGLELLPDSTFVATTYCVLTKGEKPLVVSVRFKLQDIDAKAALQAEKAPLK
jgi:hypothetical protein